MCHLTEVCIDVEWKMDMAWYQVFKWHSKELIYFFVKGSHASSLAGFLEGAS